MNYPKISKSPKRPEQNKMAKNTTQVQHAVANVQVARENKDPTILTELFLKFNEMVGNLNHVTEILRHHGICSSACETHYELDRGDSIERLIYVCEEALGEYGAILASRPGSDAENSVEDASSPANRLDLLHGRINGVTAATADLLGALLSLRVRMFGEYEVKGFETEKGPSVIVSLDRLGQCFVSLSCLAQNFLSETRDYL